MVNETRQIVSGNLPSERTRILIKIGYWFIGSFHLFLSFWFLADKIREQPSGEYDYRIAFWAVLSLSIGCVITQLVKWNSTHQSPIIRWAFRLIFVVLSVLVLFLALNLENEVIRRPLISFGPYVFLGLAGMNFGKVVDFGSSSSAPYV